MEAVLKARQLCKTFPGPVTAIDHLNLNIERGSVFGLIGRNGSGKSTLLRLFMGLLRPDAGDALILDQSLWKAAWPIRAQVSYVPQNVQLPSWMTAAELFRYTAHFYPQWDQSWLESACEAWDVPLQRRLCQLSTGEQRKAAILAALAPHPEVVLLDEPASGLDPVSRRQLLDELIKIVGPPAESTLLISTHLVGDLERLADTIGILDKGKLVLTSRLDEIQMNARRVQIIFPGDCVPGGFSLPGAIRQEVSGPVLTLLTQCAACEQMELIRRIPGVRVNLFPVSLEEFCVELLEDNSKPQTTEVPPVRT